MNWKNCGLFVPTMSNAAKGAVEKAYPEVQLTLYGISGAGTF